jgi:hypothetical protein
MIRALAVNSALILDSTKNDAETEAETSSDEMVMGAVQALCEVSVLISHQNHSDQYLTALDDSLKRFHKRRVVSENRKCRSLPRPKLMHCGQENAISYEGKRFIKSAL